MQIDTAINKLNSAGRQLYDMFAECHDVTELTGIQVERILSFQKRIIAVDDNTFSTKSTDIYPKRFKLDGKGRHGGYLDTEKFWKILSSSSYHSEIPETLEESIAQA